MILFYQLFTVNYFGLFLKRDLSTIVAMKFSLNNFKNSKQKHNLKIYF